MYLIWQRLWVVIRNGSVGQFQGTILGRTVKLEYNKLGYNKLQLKMNKQISLADLGKLTK
jgi:hypothetical protein